MDEARKAVIRPVAPERSAAQRPIDAGLGSAVYTRLPFVIARTVALIIIAALAGSTLGVDALTLGLALIATATVHLSMARYVRIERAVAWQTVVDLQLILVILVIEPGFRPVALLLIGASIAWFVMATARRTAISIGGLVVVELALVGYFGSVGGWFAIATVTALIIALVSLLAETLRADMWASESALVDVLSASGAVVHHSSLESGMVTRVEGDIQAMTGWTSEEWYSTSHREFLHPDDVEHFWIDVDSVEPNTVIDRTARVRCADGSWIWLRDIARVGVDRDGQRTLRGVSLDVTEVESLSRQLAEQTRTDPLTGLPNRTALAERVDGLLAGGQSFALLILDLDRFKQVNDTLGHEAGDRLLQILAGRLGDVVAPDDMLARLGGDEFAIVVQGACRRADLTDLLSLLASKASRPMTVRGVRISTSISVGAAFSRHHRDRGTLMRHADIAMYEAKHDPGSHRFFDDSLEQTSTLQLSLAAELPDAIRSGALMLYYQPQYDMLTGRIVGAEGLARWDHPVHGLLAPGSFLDVTLVSEHSIDFAMSTIRYAADMLRQLSDLGIEITISANIALGALRTPGFATSVLQLVDDRGVRRDRLIVELTESDLQVPSTAMLSELHSLASAGVQISIDDFGTGHSSLERVRSMPVNELKIDRSFVNGMSADEVSRHLVRSVIDLASNLGFRLVAEGVETQGQADALVAMGCEIAQGNLWSQPLAPAAFMQVVQANAGEHRRRHDRHEPPLTAAS